MCSTPGTTTIRPAARSASARKPGNSSPPTSRSNRAGRSGSTVEASGNESATVAAISGCATAYRVTAEAPIEWPTSAIRDGSTSGSCRRCAVATSRSRCRAAVEESVLAALSGNGLASAPWPAKPCATTTPGRRAPADG
jgi:hypothetical protein